MTPPLALALALLAADGAREGRAEEYTEAGRYFFLVPDDGSPTHPVYYVSARIRHEDDGPDAPPVRPRGVEGRRVRVAEDYSSVTILGGINPDDFALAVASADLVLAATPPGPADAVLARGLGHRSYATREACDGMLGRLGLPAVPRLARGLASPDAEVRLRCRAILGRIRDGD